MYWLEARHACLLPLERHTCIQHERLYIIFISHVLFHSYAITSNMYRQDSFLCKRPKLGFLGIESDTTCWLRPFSKNLYIGLVRIKSLYFYAKRRRWVGIAWQYGPWWHAARRFRLPSSSRTYIVKPRSRNRADYSRTSMIVIAVRCRFEQCVSGAIAVDIARCTETSYVDMWTYNVGDWCRILCARFPWWSPKYL
jgi:hypothetical protein